MITTPTVPAKMQHQNGFTLVEMAIVMLIVALLLGGLVPTLSSQIDQRHASETNKQLDEIKEALIGYAIINGRLPCPASITPTNSYGAEYPAGGGNCSNFYDGFVPAATLGLSGTNSSGLVVDSWGNPIRYAVTKWSGNTFTTTNGMSGAGISNLFPDLLVFHRHWRHSHKLRLGCSTYFQSWCSCSNLLYWQERRIWGNWLG